MGGRRWGYEEVKTYFEEHGCNLLSEGYGGSNDRLRYQCGCGAEAETTFRQFKYKTSRGIRRGCKACHATKMMETITARNEGKHHFQTAEFKMRRVETLKARFGVESPLQSEVVRQRRQQTCMEKYGVTHVSKDPAIAARQRQGFREKHGVSHFMHIPESREKFRQTLLERYGVPSLAHLSRCASKESQRLFWALHERLPPLLREKCYFADLNREFNISFNGEFFKFDFVHSGLRKAIEYNGWNFHPRSDQPDEGIGWCAFHPNKTVKEAREYEARKYAGLTSRGFTILTVWDRELHRNFDALVEKCMAFLSGEELR